MQIRAVRNNPFITFIMFIVAGYVFTRFLTMGERATVFCIFAFALAGLIAAVSDIQDVSFTRWERKFDSVLSMERPSVVAPLYQEEFILSNLRSSVWYGHAMNRANAFTHFIDADGDRVVIAYLGDEVIGMFHDDTRNWIVLGAGEVL